MHNGRLKKSGMNRTRLIKRKSNTPVIPISSRGSRNYFKADTYEGSDDEYIIDLCEKSGLIPDQTHDSSIDEFASRT